MNNTRGFTLIEVLIAMSLLSLMMVLLFSSLHIGAKSWQQGEEKIADINEIAVVQQFFSHHLAHALPQWNDFDPEKERVFAFQGKKTSVQFVGAFPASAERYGLQLFNVALKDITKKSAVTVSVKPFFPLAENETAFEDEVELISGVKQFELAYFGLNDETGEYQWQTEWLNKELQPRLVKIALELADGRYTPDIIVALRIDNSYSNIDLDSVPIDDTPNSTDTTQ
jgi:general secretion pathway protein J